MDRKVKSFDCEFKENAVKLVLEQGMSTKQASSDLGIGNSTLQKWVSNAKVAGGIAKSSSQKTKSAEQIRIDELEKQNRRLSMERDILKKAMAFFAEIPK